MMKYLYLMIDTSASLKHGNKFNVINDLIRTVFTEFESRFTQDVDLSIVLFSIDAKIKRIQDYTYEGYVQWEDIEEKDFFGCSNLGKAYKTVDKDIKNKKISYKDVILALVTDGEPTDNFQRELSKIDNNNESKRVLYIIGTENNGAIEQHVYANKLDKIRNDHNTSVNEFVQKIEEKLI